MSFLFGGRSNKTFKPKKNIPEGTHQYDLMKHAAATLGSGNLRLAVMLPEGEDNNEWVAVNTVDFFNQINMLYGTITEFCTEESCALMSAGPKYEYHWADGTTVKKPIKCSAPKYIDYLMTWVQDQLDDETIFPSKIGVPFPKNFNSIAKTIFKRLFRVYAHIYHQHFRQVVDLGEEAHLNTSFKHFIFFVQEFNLIDKRELAPLNELIEKLTGGHQPMSSHSSNAHSQSNMSISTSTSGSNNNNHFAHSQTREQLDANFHQLTHQFLSQQHHSFQQQAQTPLPPLPPQQQPSRVPPVPPPNPYKVNSQYGSPMVHHGASFQPQSQQLQSSAQPMASLQSSGPYQANTQHGLPAHIMFQQQQYSLGNDVVKFYIKKVKNMSNVQNSKNHADGDE
ncbi:PREDICTED: MOB kinase activator 1B-like [Rhagoletis zephyria]|uniref:MOB kinase activator 1B-like n=1 Tax=Rhagoletis zephyria TaxID=28612 RepID=UPI00081182FE|nr:PREDICTED: MOB kinase activator 1B-like [Rhagoletis zephyria]